jgi:Fe-Mn family superoxide dismutase
MAKYTLPALPYDYASLEPHIDEQTMRIHHDKHHAGYVNNLNAALEKHPEFDAPADVDQLLRSLDRVPEDIRTAVRNNGGGHANHTLFWEVMTPGGSGEPTGALADALSQKFGDFGAFKTKFSDAGKTRFGSGWAWLSVSANGELQVTSTPNQDSPSMEGSTPILGCDVWEHAYYLKYQNRRPDYLEAWWNTVNWDEVSRRYQEAKK